MNYLLLNYAILGYLRGHRDEHEPVIKDIYIEPLSASEKELAANILFGKENIESGSEGVETSSNLSNKKSATSNAKQDENCRLAEFNNSNNRNEISELTSQMDNCEENNSTEQFEDKTNQINSQNAFAKGQEACLTEQPKKSRNAKIKQSKFPSTSSIFDTFNDSLSNQNCYIAYLSVPDLTFLSILQSLNVSVQYTYKTQFNGYSFCTENPRLLQKLSQIKSVKYIEEDKVYNASGIQINPPNYMFLMMNYRNNIFNNTLLNNTVMNFLPFKYIYKFFYTYYKYEYTGDKTLVYLLDSSVDEGNKDINGRVKNMFKSNASCNYHGTNMALLIGGRKYGFAKENQIRVLNVIDCEGKAKLSDILYALEYIETQNDRTVILNLPISGPRSELFNEVADNISKMGIIVVTSAGNNRDLGCNYSPGSASSVINVGSLNEHSSVSKYSNFGGCIRIYSIGENIDIEGKKVTGTSYSSALVTSAISVFLESRPYAQIEDVWKFLIENADLEKGSFLVQKVPNLKKMKEIEAEMYEDKKIDTHKVLVCGIYILIVFLFLVMIFLFYKRRSDSSLIF